MHKVRLTSIQVVGMYVFKSVFRRIPSFGFTVGFFVVLNAVRVTAFCFLLTGSLQSEAGIVFSDSFDGASGQLSSRVTPVGGLQWIDQWNRSILTNNRIEVETNNHIARVQTNGLDQVLVLEADFLMNGANLGGSYGGATVSMYDNNGQPVSPSGDALSFRMVTVGADIGTFYLFGKTNGTLVSSGIKKTEVLSGYDSNLIHLSLKFDRDNLLVVGTASNTVTGVSVSEWFALTQAEAEALTLTHYGVSTTGYQSGTAVWDNVSLKQLPALDGTSLNVKDFGAVGDGVADDTDAFQQALSCMTAHFPTEGKKNAGVALFVPAGTYRITDRLSFISTNYPPIFDQGIVIRGESPLNTKLLFQGTNGLFFFDLAADRVMRNTTVQIEDIRFDADVADAGPAVEVATRQIDAEDLNPRVTLCLRKVAILKTELGDYFTYGVKGIHLKYPTMDSVSFMGSINGSQAGFYFEDSYQCAVKDCFITGADIAVHTPQTSEDNEVVRSVITNVNVAVRMNVDIYHRPGPSAQGGRILNSWISAYRTGIYMDNKDSFFIGNNVFHRCGSGVYTNIYLSDVRNSIVSDNRFTGSGSQIGILLDSGVRDSAERVTVAYNDFSDASFPTDVQVGSDVRWTKIIDNSNVTSNNVVNQAGTNTWSTYGSARTFVSSPASVPDNPSFVWITATGSVGNVYNVKNFGASGDGVADDTVAVTNAAASLYATLNGVKKGVLYFPAGTYRISESVMLNEPSASAGWQKIVLIGDGVGSTEIQASDTNSVFEINSSNQMEVVFRDLSVTPCKTNQPAIIVRQPGTSTSSRSLVMHAVRIKAGLNNGNFTAGLVGEGLWYPLLHQVDIEGVSASDTTGLMLSGGKGFECEDLYVHGFDTGLDIALDFGGAALIRGPVLAVNNTNNIVNVGGGIFALEGAHVNGVETSLRIQNATNVMFSRTETLNKDRDGDHPGRRTLQFVSCHDILVRDNVFNQSGPDPSNNYSPNTNRVSISFSFDTNSDAEISGNIFNESGRGIDIPPSTMGVLIDDNRFIREGMTPIKNFESDTIINLLPPEI